jgi:hypothetical protein
MKTYLNRVIDVDVDDKGPSISMIPDKVIICQTDSQISFVVSGQDGFEIKVLSKQTINKIWFKIIPKKRILIELPI